MHGLIIQIAAFLVVEEELSTAIEHAPIPSQIMEGDRVRVTKFKIGHAEIYIAVCAYHCIYLNVF